MSLLSKLLPSQKKHPFDRAHGVDTDGLIYADPAAEGPASARHNAGYYATAPSLFHGAMALWRGTLAGTGYAVEDYTLVDIGCGKGRVLMLASEYAFREIVGVELDPGLARVAQKNLRKWTRRYPWVPQVRGPREQVLVRGVEVRGPLERVPQVSRLRPGKPANYVRIIKGDALTVPLPDGPVALFYSNSFEREMTEMWLARLAELAAHRPWRLDLIYVHPEFDALVRRLPAVQELAQGDIEFTEEDADADVFGVDSDQCAVYRLAS